MQKRTSRGVNRVSLPRALSKLGLCSRSNALRLIASGSVSVNNAKVTNPHCWIDLLRDRISLEGQSVKKRDFRYVLFNKPRGIVTTKSDERGKKTVFDLVDESLHSLNPVGRLDKETSGLLLLTNDNRFANIVTSPEHEIEKVYHVGLNKKLNEADLARLREGVEISLEGSLYRTRPARVDILQDGIVELAVREGKNRQIRRMFGSLGYEVVSLRRMGVGSITLGDLKEGSHRDLTKEEVSRLVNNVSKDY
jgi:23S rRNA pseudouridine2605 synthase